MAKTIDEILDDYAVKHGYANWNTMFYDGGVEIGTKGIEEVAHTYAQQFQTNTDLITTELCVQNERIAELEDGLKDCSWTLQRVLDITQPDSDWATFTTSIVDIISLAESLINKGKEHGKYMGL